MHANPCQVRRLFIAPLGRPISRSTWTQLQGTNQCVMETVIHWNSTRLFSAYHPKPHRPTGSSADIFVFLALNRAPDFDAWQKTLRADRPEMRFVAPVDLAKHSGFLPVFVNGKRTGFGIAMKCH